MVRFLKRFFSSAGLVALDANCGSFRFVLFACIVSFSIASFCVNGEAESCLHGLIGITGVWVNRKIINL